MGFVRSSDEMRQIEAERYGKTVPRQGSEELDDDWTSDAGAERLSEIGQSVEAGDKRAEAALAQFEAEQLIRASNEMVKGLQTSMEDPEIIRAFTLAGKGE